LALNARKANAARHEGVLSVAGTSREPVRAVASGSVNTSTRQHLIRKEPQIKELRTTSALCTPCIRPRIWQRAAALLSLHDKSARERAPLATREVSAHRRTKILLRWPSHRKLRSGSESAKSLRSHDRRGSVAGLLTLTLRRNQARVRYWLRNDNGDSASRTAHSRELARHEGPASEQTLLRPGWLRCRRWRFQTGALRRRLP
jgi:hypothetical protein